MKKETIAGKLWGLIYPMLIYYAVTYLIMIVVEMVCSIYWLSKGIVSENELQSYVLSSLKGQELLFTLLAAVCTIPILVLFMRRDINKEKKYNIYRKYKINNKLKYLLIVPFGAFNMMWANMFVSAISMFMPDFMLDSYKGAEQAIYGSSVLIQILTAGIFGPIVEELIFRGLIYKRLKRWTNILPAAVISSVLFGVFHGNWVQAPYAIIIGLAAVWLYEKYKSIAAPILFHISANMISVGISFLSRNISSGAADEAQNISDLNMLTSICSTMAMFLALAVVVGIAIKNIVDPKEVGNEITDCSNTVL